MTSSSVCFGGSVITLSAVLFSLLGCCASATCPKQCRCPSSLRWKCFNVTLSDIGGFPSYPRTLKIVNLSQGNFNASLSPFRSIRKLQVHNSTISEMSGEFISKFPSVKRVEFLETTFECSEKLLPLQKWKHIVWEEKEKLVCSTLDGTTRKELLSALHEIERGLAQCPERCTCSIYANFLGNKELPNMLVNCSHASMSALPPTLPVSWTIHLDLSYNQLTQASHIFTSPVYRDVMVFNLSNNFINNYEVTMSENLNYFYVLDLSFNKLTELPNVFLGKRPLYKNHLMLEGNPWECDCHNLEKFLSLAIQQGYSVPDYDYIVCGEGNHRLNSALSNICMNSNIASSVPYLCIIQTLAAMFLIYYTNKIIRLCQSMYTRGEFHIAVHVLLRKKSHASW